MTRNKITPAPLWPYPAFMPFLPWTPVQPDLYWNTESPERALLELCRNLEKLIQYAEGLSVNTNELKALYEEVLADYENLINGGLADLYREQAKEWISENLEYIYRYTIAQIYFGLDDTGHLVAFIPESWENLSFYTPLDYSNQETYGHLQILLENVVPYIEEVEN